MSRLISFGVVSGIDRSGRNNLIGLDGNDKQQRITFAQFV